MDQMSNIMAWSWSFRGECAGVAFPCFDVMLHNAPTCSTPKMRCYMLTFLTSKETKMKAGKLHPRFHYFKSRIFLLSPPFCRLLGFTRTAWLGIVTICYSKPDHFVKIAKKGVLVEEGKTELWPWERVEREEQGLADADTSKQSVCECARATPLFVTLEMK